MGQKQKRVRQQEQQGEAEEQKRRYIEKWDQTDSPEITDKGVDIKNPRPPFRGVFFENYPSTHPYMPQDIDLEYIICKI